jgi:hypothetical protein
LLEKTVPGEDRPDTLVVQGRQGDLLEVVGALDPAGRLARRLDGREEVEPSLFLDASTKTLILATLAS